MKTKERWKTYPLHRGYKISTHGRVRGPFGLVRTSFPSALYPVFGLKCNGKHITQSVHRAMALTFLKCPAGKVVRHLDGNPYNNLLSNLKVGTQKENIADRRLHGTLSRGLGIRWRGLLKLKFYVFAACPPPCDAIAKKFKIALDTVYAIRSHKCWRKLI